MKQAPVFLTLGLCAVLLMACQAQPERVRLFDYDPRAIIIPVKVQDSITANMLFDTGASAGWLQFDSVFCAEHPLPVWSGEPVQVGHGEATGWHPSGSDIVRRSAFWGPVTLQICQADLTYGKFYLQDMKDYPVDFDGTFGLSLSDSVHIWELNFEQEYLDIHQSADFKMPDDCYLFPLIWESGSPGPSVQFPLRIRTAEGDTVTVHAPYLIDTGMLKDFVLMHNAAEIDFFRKRDDGLTLITRGVEKRYEVQATVFGDFEIDALRIYTNEYSDGLKAKGVIGLNFMKRFNVFFDLRTQQIGFQPIRNFKRVLNPDLRRYNFTPDMTPQGTQVVKELATDTANPYRKAGLRDGDEIGSINGIRPGDLTPEMAAEIRRTDKKELEIIRDGSPMKITVYTDDSTWKGE